MYCFPLCKLYVFYVIYICGERMCSRRHVPETSINTRENLPIFVCPAWICFTIFVVCVCGCLDLYRFDKQLVSYVVLYNTKPIYLPIFYFATRYYAYIRYRYLVYAAWMMFRDDKGFSALSSAWTHVVTHVYMVYILCLIIL